jgi:tryptophan synthase alpha chain
MPTMQHTQPQLPIMGHLVLGYPSLAESIRTAEQYIAAGIAILEVQIPFSHPTADGPVITAACQAAIRQNVTLADCLQATRTLREKYPQQEIMVMSYLNPVYTYGFERLRQALGALSIRHLIIPDLPGLTPLPTPLRRGGRGARFQENLKVDGDERSNYSSDGKLSHPKNLNSARGQAPLSVGGGDGGGVAILAANTPTTRLNQLLAAGYDFFYLMSDFKITGSTFSLHPGLREMAARIKAYAPENRVGIGFGIETPEQIQMVLEVADYAIIGSALIRAQQEGRLEVYLENLKKAMAPATFHS